MAATLGLQNLAQDVVLNILCYCGISGVVAVSQTCRHLNALAFTKHVWLSLLRDVRPLLDRWPQLPLHQYTTAELIDLAKRMVQGPQSWSRQHIPGPVISREEIIHPKMNPVTFLRAQDARLLSGGRYIFLKNAGLLECWDVVEDRLIWKHQSQWEFALVLDFALDAIDDEQAAVIMICQRTIYTRKNVVEVVRLDFWPEISQSLLCTHAADMLTGNPFNRPRICGDIAVLGDQFEYHILLINWRTQSSFILQASSINYDVDLLSTHIIIVERAAERDLCHVHVLDVQSLAEFWSPDDHRRVVPTRDVPWLVSATIQLPSHFTERIRMSAHNSPLREDLAIIWVYIASTPQARDDPIRKHTICKFSLITPPGTTPQMCLRLSKYVRGSFLLNRNISYAGHTSIFDHPKQMQSVRALSELEGVIDDGGYHSDNVHISAYSGAMTYPSFSSVVVNYYQ